MSFNSIDYRKYYNLESYLFNEVTNKFSEQGYLNAEDFFCIIIWKANRAKTRMADKFEITDTLNLDQAVQQLTNDIFTASGLRQKFEVLTAKNFRLPMASAVLTVLYPNDFTVFDFRVCEVLGQFKGIDNLRGDNLWLKYNEYMTAVKAIEPVEMDLRDKDRYLWGKSFYEQLQQSVANNFGKSVKV